MIVASSGRRPGSEFPEANVDLMTDRLARLMTNVRPRAVVVSAAAGADLLVARAAIRARAMVHVVIPSDIATFRSTSVADKGSTWAETYDLVIQWAADHGTLIELGLPDNEQSYLLAVDHIVSSAEAEAEHEEVVALGVWGGARATGFDATRYFAEATSLRGWTWLDLDPSIRLEDMRTAFVAMPFGTKRDPLDLREIDCDITYSRILIPALEDADLNYQRADEQVDAGLIHPRLIRSLASADVAVVDLTTKNFNVGWETGLRHVFRDKPTILINSGGSPFDVNLLAQIRFVHGGASLDEVEQLRVVRALKPYLQPNYPGTVPPDSPVHAFFPLPLVVLPNPSSAAATADLAQHLGARISRARDGQDHDELRAIEDEIGRVDLGSAIQSLRLQVGLAYLAGAAYPEAERILRALVGADVAGRMPLAREKLAIAIYKQGGADRRVEAEAILANLVEQEPTSERLSLLGSVAKRQGANLIENGDAAAATHIRIAAMRYQQAFDLNPIDFYAANNAIGLFRLLGQRLGGSPEDLERAALLIPVARFMAHREEQAGSGFWPRATVAEIAYNEALLERDPVTRNVELDEAIRLYGEAASVATEAFQTKSADEQLDLYRLLGDPIEVVARAREAVASPLVRG